MQTFLIYCIHTYNDLRTLLNHTLLKSTKNSPQFQNKAGFTARISNRRSERLIWTVARVSFQMRPSMHRKARISNPTFKTFHKTQQERRNRPPLFAYPSPCPSDAAGALSSRSMASSMARLIKPFTLSLWASAWAQQSKHSGLIPSRALSCKVTPKITLHSAFLQCSREHNLAKLRSMSSRSLRNTP